MRAIALACAAAMLGVAIGPASAEPTSPVVFTDNPLIVDSHPLRIDSWSRLDADDALAVYFTFGSPDCYGVHAVVDETPETVTVELRGGTLPESVGRMCTMIAVFGKLDVPLQGPLGDREVLTEPQ